MPDQGRIEGAILGALVGDAAGAPLEFLGRQPGAEEVERAMTMPGGGPWNVAPGQITDDGEMALSLMHGLTDHGSTSGEFPIEEVAQSYLLWLQSKPFDIGATTSRGLGGGIEAESAGEPTHQGMWRAADTHNRESKANGGLMRIAPLGVWGRRVSEEDLVKAADQDSHLTHANPVCRVAAALYALAIRHLVLNPADATGACTRAREWCPAVPEAVSEVAGDRFDTADWRAATEEVSGWLDAAEANHDPGYTPHIGFAKYGFVHAFRYLALGTPFDAALAETLRGGGDTDTNACIVGGMIGAAEGVEGIPDAMRTSVLTSNPAAGRPRPPFLRPGTVLAGLLETI